MGHCQAKHKTAVVILVIVVWAWTPSLKSFASESLRAQWKKLAIETASLYSNDRRRLAKRNLHELEELAAKIGPSSPEMALTYDALGKIAESDARYTKAESYYLKALAIWRTTSRRLATSDLLYRLSYIYAIQHRWSEAETLLRECLALRESGFDDALVEDAVGFLAEACLVQNKLEESESLHYRLYQVVQRQMLSPKSQERLKHLGEVFRGKGQPDKAELWFDRALEVGLRQFGPLHTTTMDALEQLTNQYLSEQRYDKAEQLYRRMLQHKSVRGSPASAAYFIALGELSLRRQDARAAEALFKKAYSMAGNSYPQIKQMARTFGTFKDHERAIALLQRFAALRDQRDDLHVDALKELSRHYGTDGQTLQAYEAFAQSVKIQESLPGIDYRPLVDAYHICADLAQKANRPVDVVNNLQTSIRLLEKFEGEYTLTLDGLLRKFFASLVSLHRYQEAKDAITHLIRICERSHGEKHESVARAKLMLVDMYLDMSACTEAEELLQKLLSAQLARHRQDPGIMAKIYSNLSTANWGLGRPAEASKFYRRMLAVRPAADRRNATNHFDDLLDLAVFEQMSGNFSTVKGLLSQAQDLLSGGERHKSRRLAEQWYAYYKATGDRQRVIQFKYQVHRPDNFAKHAANSPSRLLARADYESMIGRIAEARRTYLRFAKAAEVRPYVSRLKHAQALHAAAVISQQLGDLDQAADLLRKEIMVKENDLGRDHIDLADTLWYLANTEALAGKYQSAQSHYLQVLKILDKWYKPPNARLSGTYRSMCDALLRQARALRRKPSQLAETYILRALAQDRVMTRGEESPLLAYDLAYLAQVRASQGRAREADELFDKALSLTGKFESEFQPPYTTWLEKRAQVYMDANNLKAAQTTINRCLTLKERAYGKSNLCLLSTLSLWADLLDRQNKRQQAALVRMRMHAIRYMSAQIHEPPKTTPRQEPRVMPARS